PYGGPPAYAADDDERTPGHAHSGSTMRLLTNADDAPSYMPYVHLSAATSLLSGVESTTATLGGPRRAPEARRQEAAEAAIVDLLREAGTAL
ncbi:hypothetical protein K505DRAFT_191904, partial [Melanomma pulvis-pyrius CBS 109.77]